MKAAAAGMKRPLRTIQAAKSAGCPAFRSNRIYEGELLTWLADHPEISKLRAGDDLKGRKLREEIRKLKLANDLKADQLISRQWMAERWHACGGDLDRLRLKSEGEDPQLFAAAQGDVPACRAVVQKIWDGIMGALSETIGAHFDEKAKAEKGTHA